MDQRWQRLTEIFDAALERAPADRGRFLDDACASDPELRAEVESLLAAHDRADAFLEQSAAPAAIALASASSDRRSPGEMLGTYRIEREIGRGGMGVVYLAEDTRLGRRVALKVISSAVGGHATGRERLRREARAAAGLSHAAIATVLSFEEIDGHACLVTEYVKGDTLRAEIARGPLPVDLVLETGIQVARGLAAAHAAGVVHRDLKPENVMRSRQGELKILDFGIARVEAPPDPAQPRLTSDGMIVGTPGYMSPEQLDGADVDERTDIFALGVLLYELATGSHPFNATTPGGTVAKVMAADPPRLETFDPSLPLRLDAILRKCLKPHRSDRYASALDVARDLQSLRERTPVTANEPVGPDTLAAPATGGSPAAAAGSNPLWWWRLHQAGAMIVEGALVYGVWRMHATIHQDWSLSIFLAYIITGAVNGTLRTHLLVTTMFNMQDMDEQLRRATPLIRGTDMIVALLLLTAAAAVARVYLLLPSVLTAFGVGWAVTSLIVEPATRKAAFSKSQ
jgi:eukaryotic-like serine/threonine-protein kinase